VTKLTLTANQTGLSLKTEPIRLVLSMPIPIGVGEANTGVNVGGAAGEIFRDKTGEALNFRTIEGVGIAVETDGDIVRLTDSGGNEVCGESPSGTKDGVNAIFTTANDFRETSLKVYFNGIRQAQGTGCDYEVSESGGVGTGFDTITVAVPPRSNESLLVDYVIA